MDDVQPEVSTEETASTPSETAPAAAPPEEAAAPAETPAAESKPEAKPESKPESGRPERGPRPEGQRKEGRPQGQQGQGQQAQGQPRGDRPRGENRDRRPGGPPGGGDRGGERRGEGRGDGPRGDRGDRGGRPGGGRPFEGAPDIELEKLISDSLYLDNQAHAVVARMRDMDSGTKTQLRRLYNAVRRAVRAPESERQHEFVMVRARLAYTIARHSLRSLDALERLLLQVTRRNDARGYERFRDLFEAIVAYNE